MAISCLLRLWPQFYGAAKDCYLRDALKLCGIFNLRFRRLVLTSLRSPYLFTRKRRLYNYWSAISIDLPSQCEQRCGSIWLCSVLYNSAAWPCPLQEVIPHFQNIYLFKMKFEPEHATGAWPITTERQKNEPVTDRNKIYYSPDACLYQVFCGRVVKLTKLQTQY